MRSLLYLICSFWLSYAYAGRIGYSIHATGITYVQRKDASVVTYPLNLFTTYAFTAFTVFANNKNLTLYITNLLSIYWLCKRENNLEKQEKCYQNFLKLFSAEQFKTMSNLIQLVSTKSQINIPNITESSFAQLDKNSKDDLDRFMQALNNLCLEYAHTSYSIGYSSDIQRPTRTLEEYQVSYTFPFDLFTAYVYIAYIAFGKENSCWILLLVDLLNSYWLCDNRADLTQKTRFYENLKALLIAIKSDSMLNLINLAYAESGIQIPNIFDCTIPLREPSKHDLDRFIGFIEENPSLLERV